MAMAEERGDGYKVKGGPSDVERTGRIPELDGLRYLFILLIVAKHYGFTRLPLWTQSDFGHFVHRFVTALNGVDFFFVLSGFLLGRILLKDLQAKNYYRTFYVRRVSRTFPLYFLLLVSFIVAVLLSKITPLGRFDWPFETPLSLIAYAVFIQNFVMAAMESLGPDWLEITWSLAVQEQFYLILPFLLKRFRRSDELAVVLISLIVLAPICRFAFALEYPPSALRYLDVLLVTRMDSLAMGVLFALVVTTPTWQTWMLRWQRAFIAVAALLLGLFAALVYCDGGVQSKGMFVIGHTVLSLVYINLILLAFFQTPYIFNRLLRVPLLGHLGRISYGIFLFHQCVLIIVHRSFGEAPSLSNIPGILPPVIGLLLTILLAALLWRWVEKPIIDWTRRTGDTPNPVAMRSLPA